MIKTLTKRELQKLEGYRGTVAISIYLQTKPGFVNAQENTIVCKNVLKTARHMCKSSLMPADIRRSTRWLSQADALLYDMVFWKECSSGLALFISGSGVYAFKVDEPFEERVYVGSNFVFEPLRMSQSKRPQHYFVLALSQKDTRLFESAHGEMREIARDTMSHSFAIGRD